MERRPYPIQISRIQKIRDREGAKPIEKPRNSDGQTESVGSKRLRGYLTGNQVEIGCTAHVIEE
jgi:hypothetical protein